MRINKGFSGPAVAAEIQALLGPDYVVKDRMAQEESFLKLMRIEKWLSFAIPGLMLLLVSFNLIGALWMIVLEKARDISVLKTMGMTDAGVRRIFLYQGLLLCGLGVAIGFGLAVILYILQKTVGIITLPGEMLIDAYPVSLRWYDFLVVLTVVFGIGYLASILPSFRAARMPAMFREE
jgi:lipoprotein-releasing system permease protein